VRAIVLVVTCIQGGGGGGGGSGGGARAFDTSPHIRACIRNHRAYEAIADHRTASFRLGDRSACNSPTLAAMRRAAR